MEDENSEISNPFEENADDPAGNSNPDSSSISIDKIAELLQLGNLEEADSLWKAYFIDQRQRFFTNTRQSLSQVYYNRSSSSSVDEIKNVHSKLSELVDISFEELVYIFSDLLRMNSENSNLEEVSRIRKALSLLEELGNGGINKESYSGYVVDHHLDFKKYFELIQAGNLNEADSFWSVYILELRSLFFRKHRTVLCKTYDKINKLEDHSRDRVLAKIYELIDATIKELLCVFYDLINIYQGNNDLERIPQAIKSLFILDELSKEGFDSKYTKKLKEIVFLYEKRDFRKYIPVSSKKGRDMLDDIKVKELIALQKKIMSALDNTPLNSSEILGYASDLSDLFVKSSSAFQSNSKGVLVSCFKKLMKKRKNLKQTEDVRILSGSMLKLARGLCTQIKFEPNDRFNDLFDVYLSIKNDKELRENADVRLFVSNCLREAREIGKKLAERIKPKVEAVEWKEVSFFLSRLGEVCRAHRHFDCAGSDLELDAITLEAIAYLESAINHTNEIKDKGNNYRQIGECYEALNEYEKAIEAYKKLVASDNQVDAEKSWEARKNIAECYRNLGQMEFQLGDHTVAEEHFLNSEHWFLEASKIWEPTLDIKTFSATNQNNATLHGLLAWLYLVWSNYTTQNRSVKLKLAENQSLLFLAIEKIEQNSANQNSSSKHRNNYSLTWKTLGISLFLQERNDEAIEVFKELIKRELEPKHEFQILFYLKRLFLIKKGEQVTAGVSGDWDKEISELDSRIHKILGDVDHDSINSLTEEQLLVLLGQSDLSEYIRNCDTRLKSGEARELYKELHHISNVKKWLDFFRRDDPVFMTLRGNVYREVGNFEKAINKYFYALKISSKQTNKSSIFFELGKTYLQWTKFVDAAKAFDESYRLLQRSGGRNLGDSVFNSAHSYRLAKKYNKAIECLSFILNNKQNVFDEIINRARIELAVTYFELNNKYISLALREINRLDFNKLGNHELDEIVSLLINMLPHSPVPRKILIGLLSNSKEVQANIIDNLRKSDLYEENYINAVISLVPMNLSSTDTLSVACLEYIGGAWLQSYFSRNVNDHKIFIEGMVAKILERELHPEIIDRIMMNVKDGVRQKTDELIIDDLERISKELTSKGGIDQHDFIKNKIDELYRKLKTRLAGYIPSAWSAREKCGSLREFLKKTFNLWSNFWKLSQDDFVNHLCYKIDSQIYPSQHIDDYQVSCLQLDCACRIIDPFILKHVGNIPPEHLDSIAVGITKTSGEGVNLKICISFSRQLNQWEGFAKELLVLDLPRNQWTRS